MELTDQQGWSRRHGAIVGGVDSRELIADLLHERNILAEIQWFDDSDVHVSMVLAERHGRIATVEWDGDTPGELTEGPLIEDLVEELATILDAEVRIGSFVADHLPQATDPATDEAADVEAEPVEEPEFAEAWAGEDNDYAPAPRASRPDQEDVFPASVRMVEISRTPVKSLPLFAALQGAPLGSAELTGEQRALFAHLTNGRKGWGFGELPTVTLVMDHDGVTIILVTDDHVENMSAFDWTMHRQLIAGSRMDISAGRLPDNLADLVTKRQDLLRIAQAVDGANAHLFALAALEASAKDDWQVAVAALGLPDAVVDFLAGNSELDALEGVTVHQPVGVSKAIGHSVDKALEEAATTRPLWEPYQKLATERPGLVKGVIAAEALAGAGLLVCAVASRRRSPFWRKVAGFGGSVLIVDAIAELGILSWLKKQGM